MVCYTVECEDVFTGEEKKVDLYFHLTEAELTLLDLSANNKYSLFKEGDVRSNEENVKLFQKLIASAYGKRTESGQFIKNDEIRDSFLCSPEYSEFLTKIISGEIKVDDFIIGCLPKKVSKRLTIVDGKPVIKDMEETK